MNFEQALLWTVLTLMIGCFAYIFYVVIKEHRDDKDEPGNKNKKRETPKPTAIPAGKSATAKANQGGTSIVAQLSDIRNSIVKVVNITNYPPGSDQAIKEQDPDISRGNSFFYRDPLCNTKTSSPGKDRKGRARVYTLNKGTSKMSTPTKRQKNEQLS